MNELIPQKKTVKFAATLAALSFLVYVFCLVYVSYAISNAENMYQDIESESFKKEKAWTIETALESNKDTIQTLRNFFIQKGDEVKFIEEIEKIARQSGIEFKISFIDVRASMAKDLKEDVSVRIETEGSWKNILNFADRLEKLPFGVSIEDAQLDSEGAGRWSGFIEFIVFREK